MTDTLTKDAAAQDVLDRVIGQIQDMTGTLPGLPQRPDLKALKAAINDLELRGGPSDAKAYHDFTTVQIAFKNVWMQAFDASLRGLAEELYHETTRLYDDAGLTVPPIDEMDDVAQLQDFMALVQQTIASSAALGGQVAAPAGVASTPSGLAQNAFPGVLAAWNNLSRSQQIVIEQQAILYSNGDADQKQQAARVVQIVLENPQGSGGRLANLLTKLGKALSEPYAFDVFAPDTYNFGIMVTYRQQWDPLSYQAGNLVATIPLAPGETRKYSKKQTVKTTRARKEIEKSVSSRSVQSSETARAELEIMTKAVTATNFKLTAHGSFNIGVGSIDATNEFALNQQNESNSTKKDFHEATLRAAEEYRLERSLEVETTALDEAETTSSGEISNPNNELTVTYLFYELQRQYQITEQIHRARAVILVAQDVPAPHQIDEAWLISNQWVLSRVLLDESFRSALQYLSTGFAGDEVSLEIVKANWTAQGALVQHLEGLLGAQIAMRDSLRDALVNTALGEDLSKSMEMTTGQKILTLDLAPDPNQTAADMLEAHRKAAQTRLDYVEAAVADAQKKLGTATNAFMEATKEYADAMSKQYSRHVAIDQLRVHVKKNIIYYMQAIWDHEPPDQRFFRLYNKKVQWTKPVQGCWLQASNPKDRRVDDRLKEIQTIQVGGGGLLYGKQYTPQGFEWTCGPMIGQEERELVEVADLDSPLGYKGNYIIFPLRESCYLTSYMLAEYVDEYFGVRDPDKLGNYSIEDLTAYVAAQLQDDTISDADKKALKDYFAQRLTEERPASDKIIVPTGQLFIEALPGSHVLLEDFKLLHRIEDVRKVVAEVRHAELENLRLAARLVNNEREDPDIDRKIVVDGASSVTVGTN